jgi:hypothetical protein
MSIFPTSRSVVRALLLACLLAGGAISSRAAVVLDWDSATWTPGSRNTSYDLNGDTVTDITISMTSTPANIWDPDPLGTLTPTINQTLTGGLPLVNGVIPKSLMLAADLKTKSDITVQLSFTAGNQLGTNVSFTIFDIDVATNSDIISGIYGVALDGSKVAATITNVGSAATLTGAGLTYVLTGNTPSLDNLSTGNATISFGSAVLTDVFFVFSNNQGAPFYQDIALGDINFTPVPEINPAVASVGSCLAATGMMLLVHRRRKAKPGASDSAAS